MASSVIPPVPVQALLIYDIGPATIIDGNTPCIIDNRSPARQNNFHSYRVAGSGSWSVEMFFADGFPITAWTSYGTTGQVDQSSQSGIGYGIDPPTGSHDFVSFVITGNATILNYSGLRGIWSLPSAGSISFPITPSQGGTGNTTAPVTSFNTRTGDVTLAAADITAAAQDVQTSASPAFAGLSVTAGTIATFTGTTGTIATFTATTGTIATLNAAAAAFTSASGAPLTVTRTGGGTAISVAIGDISVASGAATVSGTITGGALSTGGALTAASGSFSGSVSIGGTLSVGTFSSTSPFSIIVGSGTALVASQTAGGTAISCPVGNIVLGAGSITVSGAVNCASVVASGSVSGASAAVSGLVAAGSVTSAATVVATGDVSGGSLTTAGALSSASAVVSGAAVAASVKITAIASYANNSAALLGGLVAGQLYHITGTDQVGVVH